MAKESAHSKPHHEHEKEHSHQHEHGSQAHTHEHQHEKGGEHSHHHSHEHTEHDAFLASIRQLKEAEKSAEALLEAAKKQAASVEAQGRERAVEVSVKATERAVQAKNEILAEGREKTAKEVAAIEGEAKKQAEKVRAKRLVDREVDALSKSVL